MDCEIRDYSLIPEVITCALLRVEIFIHTGVSQLAEESDLE